MVIESILADNDSLDKIFKDTQIDKNIIPWGSIKHKILYLYAEKIISYFGLNFFRFWNCFFMEFLRICCNFWKLFF